MSTRPRAAAVAVGPARRRSVRDLLPRSAHARARAISACALVAAALVVACGPKSMRDPNVPAREVSYNDDCHLQAYFDERAGAGLPPLGSQDESVATTAKGITIGEGTYALHDPLVRHRLAKLLGDEFQGISDKMIQSVDAGDLVVTVHARWWDSGATRRLRQDAQLVVTASAGSVELPPNVCVGDLLFGDELYAKRRRYLRNEVDLATGRPAEASTPDDAPATPLPKDAPAPSATSAASTSAMPSATPAPSASPPAAAPSSSAKKTH